jgi:hypothetical protein
MGPANLLPKRLVEGKLLVLPPKRMLEGCVFPKREPEVELKRELLAKRLPVYGFLKSKREPEAGFAGYFELFSEVAGLVPKREGPDGAEGVDNTLVKRPTP